MKPKFKLGQKIWAIGLTVRNAGTQNPIAYYLPLRAKIYQIRMRESWNGNIAFEYWIERPEIYKKRTKKYRGPITTLNNELNGQPTREEELSTFYNKILNLTNKTNEIVRNYEK